MRLLFAITLILILSLVHNEVLAQYDFLLHKKFAERTSLLDSTIKSEQEIIGKDQLGKNIQLLYQKAKTEKDKGLELELAINAHRFLDKDFKSEDQRINFLQDIQENLNKKKHPEYETLLKYQIGRIYFKRKKEYLPAFRYYINVHEDLKRYSYHDFPEKKAMLIYMANAYMNLGDCKNAIKLYREADIIPVNNRYSQRLMYTPINGIGLCYRNSGMYDSAISYFNNVRKMAIVNHDPEWEGIACGNMGSAFYYIGQYDTALYLIQRELKLNMHEGNKKYETYTLNAIVAVANIHVLQDSLIKAKQEINEITQNKDSYNDQLKFGSIYYPLLSKYYYKIGDYKSAYVYRDSAAYYTATLTHRDNILELEKAKFRSEIEHYDVELTQLASMKKLTEQERDGLLIGIILLFIIIILILNRYRLKNKINQNELNNYTKRLQEKSALIEKLEQNLSAARREDQNNDLLQQLYTSTILTDEEWENFRKIFEQVHKGFIHKLRERIQGLTPADMRFLVLTKLKMSNKEMAAILGIQPDSIRTYKYRLRKKLDLGEDDSIQEYIAKL